MDQDNNLGIPNPVVPQQPIANSTNPNVSNGKKKISFIFLILIVLLVMLGGIFAIFFSRNSETPVDTSQVPTSTPQITVVPSPSEESFEITLEKNKKTEINLNNIFLTYISSEIPGETCFDCISSTVVQAELNGETRDVLYECGGITGECVVRQDLYGIGLELVQQVDTNTVRMKVYYVK